MTYLEKVFLGQKFKEKVAEERVNALKVFQIHPNVTSLFEVNRF